MHRTYAALSSALAFALPIAAQALTYDVIITNADVSFSPPAFAVGDRVRIYAIVRNLGDRDVEGNVFFSEHGVSIGTPPHFSAKMRSAEEEVWVDWYPTAAGERQIFVRVVSDPRTPDQDRSNNETIVRVQVAPRPPPSLLPQPSVSVSGTTTSTSTTGAGTAASPQGSSAALPVRSPGAGGARATTPVSARAAPTTPPSSAPARSPVAIAPRFGNPRARSQPIVAVPSQLARAPVAPARERTDEPPSTAPLAITGAPPRLPLPPIMVANLLGNAPSSTRATVPIAAGSVAVLGMGILARLLWRSRRGAVARRVPARSLEHDDLA